MTTTISLTDLSEATKEYLDHEVTVEIGRITDTVETGEEGTFTVRVTNAGERRGIRLHDVTVHLTVARGAICKLDPFVATLLETRGGGSRSDPRLPLNTDVTEMYVFFPEDSTGLEPTDVLEPGEVIEFQVTYRGGERAGTTDLTAHVHASIRLEELFPRTRGRDADAEIEILRR